MRKPITVVLFFLLISNLYPQSGWYWVNPKPQGNHLLDLVFINSNTGFAAGGSGTILKTTDGGISWVRCYTNNFNRIFQIKNIGNTIVATSNPNNIIKSTNLGVSWQLYNTGSPVTIHSVAFKDQSTGFVIGYNSMSKTTDGGVSWNVIQTGLPGSLDKITFVNQNTGYLAGDLGACGKTTDGGETWITLNLSSNTYILDYNFINPNTGYFAGFPTQFRKTTDGGTSWFGLTLPIYYVSGIDFIDYNTGFITGEWGLIIKTTNSGVSWDSIRAGASFERFRSIEMLNSTTGIVVGEGGSIYRTTNTGDNWFPPYDFPTRRNIKDIHFPTSTIGYATKQFDTTVLKTTDSGESWFNITSNKLFYPDDIYFLNENTGFVTSLIGRCYKTTDGGASWDSVNNGITFSGSEDITFINNNTGFITAKDGKIFRTSNSGISWSLIQSPLQAKIKAIEFYGENTGYAAADNGRILKTSNSGIEWEILPQQLNSNLYDLSVIDGMNVFVTGSSQNNNPNEAIYSTTNGGLNWNPSTNNESNFYNSIDFLNSITGYCVLGKNLTVRTTNSGNSWQKVTVDCEHYLNKVTFINDSIGFVGGDYGTIMKTIDGGSVNISSYSNTVASSFTLFQNYPNPFNPSTKIRFDIPRSEFVNLKVYNSLGQVVAILVNENLKAGTYEYSFDGLILPSGIYFYKLQSGDFSETKKMVLIK